MCSVWGQLSRCRSGGLRSGCARQGISAHIGCIIAVQSSGVQKIIIWGFSVAPYGKVFLLEGRQSAALWLRNCQTGRLWARSVRTEITGRSNSGPSPSPQLPWPSSSSVHSEHLFPLNLSISTEPVSCLKKKKKKVFHASCVPSTVLGPIKAKDHGGKVAEHRHRRSGGCSPHGNWGVGDTSFVQRH